MTPTLSGIFQPISSRYLARISLGRGDSTLDAVLSCEQRRTGGSRRPDDSVAPGRIAWEPELLPAPSVIPGLQVRIGYVFLSNTTNLSVHIVSKIQADTYHILIHYVTVRLVYWHASIVSCKLTQQYLIRTTRDVIRVELPVQWADWVSQWITAWLAVSAFESPLDGPGWASESPQW